MIALLTLYSTHSTLRTTVTFDYDWKFQLGDPATAQPPLEVASLDSSFTPNSTNGQHCHGLAWSQLGRMGRKDCRGACSGPTPGCLMWQYFDAPKKSCYIHDGTQGPPSCDGHGTGVNESFGESRATVPPAIGDRTGVTWKETTFDDSKWDSVNLPHDFVKLSTYSEDADGHHGYLSRDTAGWYRKSFTLPAEWTTPLDGKGGGHSNTWLHFEGVFQAVDIFLNGNFIFRHTSGYLGFDLPLHDALLATAGATNVLAMRVDASFGSGHWYEGGGVQRRVWLHHVPTGSAARFVDDGLFALTANSTITGKKGASAHVVPTAEVLATADAKAVRVTFRIIDPATHALIAMETTVPRTLDAGTTMILELKAGAMLTIENPKLWSVRTPTQYILACELSVDGTAVDEKNVSIGIRNFNWRDEENNGGGATLNGDPLRIRGFSHHSDFGGVGGAVPDRVNLFRAQALRSVGGNTWRTSHNPYRPAMYDILDAVGVLVWDENRDFNQMNVNDMERLVRRDRNHPSVIIWSACNEIECWVAGNANRTGKMMREATKKWDTTRPFSGNLNQVHSTVLNYTAKYLAAYLDVEGFSHGSIANPGAALIHTENPKKAMVSSECCSCRTQRGEDGPTNVTAGISYPHDIIQAQCMRSCMNLSYPYSPGNPSPFDVGVIAGTLGVWTLFDYGGEPGPWPIVSSSFGQFDLAGFPKSASFWYRALWLADVKASDAGRAPLPVQHVARVSQTWSTPASLKPGPPLWPADCNTSAWRATCDPHGDATLKACNACEKKSGKEKLPFAKQCQGHNNVWANLCAHHGVMPIPGEVPIQVFSDLPKVTLFVNGDKVGEAPCEAGGFASFPKGVIFKAGSNLTALAEDPKTGAMAVHTQINAPLQTATRIILSLDVPSAATGTGTALLLDGHDAALARASVVDAKGNVVQSADHLITFAVTSGPGVLAGVHNGDAKSHEPQAADHRHAYHGLARVVVKVTKDAVSHRALLAAIGDASHTVKPGSAELDAMLAGGIVVTATAHGLTSGSVTISISADEATDSVLNVAAASVRASLAFE